MWVHVVTARPVRTMGAGCIADTKVCDLMPIWRGCTSGSPYTIRRYNQGECGDYKHLIVDEVKLGIAGIVIAG